MTSAADKPTTTLPGKYFTDPEIYRQENEKIFSRQWVYVGRESALEAEGSFFVHTQEEERIIIVQAADGKPRAFYDLCRHRGTGLCSSDEGKFGKYITCPYHAWSYSLDGELASAPNMEETAGFQKDDYPLKAAHCETLMGAILINLSDDPDDFGTHFAPLEKRFGPWGIGDLRTAHQEEYDVAANWKLIVQNIPSVTTAPPYTPP